MTEITAGDVQQMLTDKRIPCPDCSKPMVGARITGTPVYQGSAFIGLVCVPCDAAYHYGKDD